MKISLLMPTRNRPDNVKRVYTSAMAMADDPAQIEFCLYVDDDDNMTAKAVSDLGSPDSIQGCVGERIVLSEMWNKCATFARGDVMGHMGDDNVFQTPGWDTKILQAFERFPDRIAFVHGRDGVHDARFGTHGFIHRTWMDTVGQFVLNDYSSDWCDQEFNDIANALERRVFLPDVYIEHLHPDVGKAVHDQNHLDRMARGARDGVKDLYGSDAYRRNREEAIEKLRAVINA